MAKKKAIPETAAVPVDAARCRAHWIRRQGLIEPEETDPARTVAATGWLRTLAGVEAYLAIRARSAGATRAGIDAASADLAYRVVPAARGCMYLVPAKDAPLALGIAEASWRPRTTKELAKADATWDEVTTCAEALLEVLTTPLTTQAAKKALPDGVNRSLGAAGKKVGLSSLLPVALRDLELRGRIVRTLEGGRLDSDRFLWKTVATPKATKPDEASLVSALASHYFRIHGPATRRQFAAWSGQTQTAAKAAIAALPLVAAQIPGFTEEAYVFEDELKALQAAEVPGDLVVFLGVMDNLVGARGGLAPFVESEHHAIPVSVWGKKTPSALGEANHLAHRTFVLGDRVAGYWECDMSDETVVVAPFGSLPKGRVKAVEAAAKLASRFLLDELGSARYTPWIPTSSAAAEPPVWSATSPPSRSSRLL